MTENSEITSSDSDEIQSSDEVPEYDEDKIVKIAYAIRDYFSKDDPHGSKFYNNIDKDGHSKYYYDGICIDSYNIFIFAMSIIDSGDDTYNNYVISKDPRWYLTVEFYNKLFDIVIHPYW